MHSKRKIIKEVCVMGEFVVSGGGEGVRVGKRANGEWEPTFQKTLTCFRRPERR